MVQTHNESVNYDNYDDDDYKTESQWITIW